jgi:hypothetical protein
MIDIEGRLSKFSIPLKGGVHFGARALLVIWFGCIARLSQWGLLSSVAPRGRGGGSQHPVISSKCTPALQRMGWW